MTARVYVAAEAMAAIWAAVRALQKQGDPPSLGEVVRRTQLHVSTVKRARALDPELDAAIRRRLLRPAPDAGSANRTGAALQAALSAIEALDRDELLKREKERTKRLKERVNLLVEERDSLEAQILELEARIAELQPNRLATKIAFVPANDI